MSTGLSLADMASIDAPIIACDLDDVLCATNQAVAEWHNDTYNTSMDLSMFLYYYYWRNPFWGTPEETVDKVVEFYKTNRLDEALPIEGALEGVLRLKELGFKLVIVTARHSRERERSLKWIEKHYPNVFETIICTGQSQETIFGDNVTIKLTKAGVCKEINALCLIDDSLENALACATSAHPIPTLLFGAYEWNKRRAHLEEETEISYEERTKREGGRDWWNDDLVELPRDGTRLYRTKNWQEVVAWVERVKEERQI